MVAVEQPRADCGHAAALTQQCGRCLRWCCPECYAPWTALSCGDCRAEARAATARDTSSVPAFEAEVPTIEVTLESLRCRTRSSRSRSGGSHRHKNREPADVNQLAARVADLERLLSELKGGS